MDIKLTNGTKTITRSKEQYEANKNHFQMRGYSPVGEAKKEIKKSKINDIVEKVVQLKPKKKKGKKK